MIDQTLIEGFTEIIKPLGQPEGFAVFVLDKYITDLHQELVASSAIEGEDPVDYTSWWLYEDDQRITDLEDYLESVLPEDYREQAFEFIIENIPSELLRIREESIESVRADKKVKPTYSLSEFKQNMGNWRWRISNLYKVVNKQSKIVTFKPNPTQLYVLENIHPRMWIVKSRQHGITTEMGIWGTDQTVFNPNKSAAIIAHNLREVRRIFKTKVDFPYHSLPEPIREVVYTTTRNTNELALSNNSTFYVTVSARSGTLNFVLITELGILYWHSPTKAEEVISGTLEALHKGNFGVVESTPYGLTGFYDRTLRIKKECEDAQRVGRKLDQMQYKFIFLPWYMDPENQSSPVELTEEEISYFKSLEIEQAVNLSENQKAWYCHKRRSTSPALLWREHPSTIEEAFKGSVEGAFFTNEVAKIYSEGRVISEQYNPDIPLRIAWDLGMSDLMVLIFYQVIQGRRRVVHVYSDSNKGLEHYIRYIETTKYGFNDNTTLIFPHDIKVRELSLKTGENRLSHLSKLQIKLKDGRQRQVKDLPILRIARARAKIEDIDRLRDNLQNWEFVGSQDPDSDNTKLLRALSSYGRQFNQERQVYEDRVRHDIHSHYVDALMVAENSLTGKVFTIQDLPF